MIDRKTWDEFKDVKLLWWINRLLHTFGWAIVYDVDAVGTIVDVYPARVSFRGFCEESEELGFIGLTAHIKNTIDDLNNEVQQ